MTVATLSGLQRRSSLLRTLSLPRDLVWSQWHNGKKARTDIQNRAVEPENSTARSSHFLSFLESTNDLGGYI